jgi:recombination protein RecA
MDDNRQKALEAALSQIEKQFGKGSIMRLGEQEVSPDLKVVSTGSLGLDLALGIGGCRAAGSSRYTDRNRPERRH